MLVMSRKIGEAVMIGPRLHIEVANVDTDEAAVELVVRGGALPTGNGHTRGSRGGVILRIDESYAFAPGVTITLVDVRPDDAGAKARLGITAPPTMTVHRREVFEAIEKKGR